MIRGFFLAGGLVLSAGSAASLLVPLMAVIGTPVEQVESSTACLAGLPTWAALSLASIGAVTLLYAVALPSIEPRSLWSSVLARLILQPCTRLERVKFKCGVFDTCTSVPNTAPAAKVRLDGV